jgi:hypothetical protein
MGLLGVAACGNGKPDHTVRIEDATFYNYGRSYIDVDGIRYQIFDNSPAVEYLGKEGERRYRCFGDELDIVTMEKDDYKIRDDDQIAKEALQFVCADQKITPGELTYPEGTKIDTSDLPIISSN